MSTTKTLTIGAHTVCAAMASAVRQDELLSLIAQPIFQSFAIAAQGGVEVNSADDFQARRKGSNR